MQFRVFQLGLAAAGLLLMGGCAPEVEKVAEPVRSAPAIVTHGEMMKTIAFHQERVERDPQGAIGFAMLSESYLALANAEDDDHAAQHAEEAARESLKIREVGNSRAARRLTEALMAQHRFAEAEESARLAVRLSGEDVQSVRLLGDVLLELGKYDEFEKSIVSRSDMQDSPEGLAMLARWNEVIGDPHMSLGLMQRAVDLVVKGGPGHETVEAWYRVQLGWTALRLDEQVVATKEFKLALELNPRDRKAFAGLARQAFERGDWEECVKFADQANTIAPLTDVLGWKALALKELGRGEESEKVATLIEKLNTVGDGHSHGDGAQHSRHTHNRLYATFLANAGRDLKQARKMALEDLKWRKDIHAYDTLAWASYQAWKESGQKDLLKEAREAVGQATRTGTKDPTILAHAKEILAN